MERDQVITTLTQHSHALTRFGVESLSLFGSVVRGESQAESDVDILVEFEGKATFDRYLDLKFFLENLLGSRVDLVTRKALRPSMRSSIEEQAVRVA